MSQRPTIHVFPTEGDSYLRITETRDAHHNLGCITHTGVLNVKSELFKHAGRAEDQMRKAQRWEELPKGTTLEVGGSGYESYASFDSTESAVRFLRRFFQVNESH